MQLMKDGKRRKGLRTDQQLQNSALKSSIGTGLRPPSNPTWYETFAQSASEQSVTQYAEQRAALNQYHNRLAFGMENKPIKTDGLLLGLIHPVTDRHESLHELGYDDPYKQ